MNDKNTYKVIISGGGTGGHVFPAIAIAEALKKLMPEIDILFVGAKGKLEMEKVPAAGFPIEGLWISGLRRKLTLKNLSFPFKLISSLWKSRQIVSRFKPTAVVGVGGYASGPVLKIATGRNIPSLILEQNSFPGLANRLIAKKVDRICVAYSGMDRFFEKSKIRLTGNPIRESILNTAVSKEEARLHYGLLPDKPTVFLTGGSLGARSLNDGILTQHKMLEENQNVQLLWQCGKLYEEKCTNAETAKLPNVKVQAFMDRMDLAYKAADVVIARAGALTISELCVLGKAAVLVPSPNVAEDHQLKNALALVKNDAAILVEDSKAEQAALRAVSLLENEQQRLKMMENIQKMAKLNAAENIAKEVLSLCERKSPQ